MTVTLYPDEQVTALWQFSKLPVGNPDVELYGVWYPMLMDPATKTGALLLCGALIDPTPVGYIVITRDILPRVRADGRIHTSQWVRIRPIEVD